MERRSGTLGCIIVGLGLLLSCVLLPYFVSSAYSILAALLQVQAAPNWLWGDWLNTVVGRSDLLYMLLAEGPICCGAAITLLITILGLVLLLNYLMRRTEFGEEDEVISPDEW
jgi:hypothetical protein